jgi:hypothetical protein
MSEPVPTSTRPAASAPPPWFRTVVWDSLLGGACPLLPLPVVDDLALAGVRRRMVGRLVAPWGVQLAPHQLAHLAGGPRPWTASRMAAKMVLYPIKKLFKKVLYFLAVKEGVDTFSELFHQGYLLHAALARGALGGGGPVSDERVMAVAGAVHGTLAETDTRPLRRVVVGVLRNSKRLVRGMLSWLAARLTRGGREALAQVEEAGAATGPTAAGSPEAEQLLDRLLVVLWGEERYRRGLEQELERRLA